MELSAATVRLAAVASTALQPLLTRPERSGTLLGVSEHAAWIGIDDEVIVLSDREAVRLPNAVELAVNEVGRWIDRDDAVSLGDGIISVGQLTAVCRRWFDPRPALGKCPTPVLRRNLQGLSEMTEVPDYRELRDAFADRDTDAILEGAVALLGKGEGLTPEGDDVLAGALASHLLLAGAVDREISYLGALIQPLTDLSRTRTTSFSAALIRQALVGRVSLPFAGLLHALTGRGDLIPSAERLLAVGHSSGPALAAGVLIGGSTIILENAS